MRYFMIIENETKEIVALTIFDEKKEKQEMIDYLVKVLNTKDYSIHQISKKEYEFHDRGMMHPM